MSQSSLLLSIAVLLALSVLVVSVLLIRSRGRVVHWIEALFRRPRKPAKAPGSDHYYKPYWS